MAWLHTEVVDTIGPLEYVLNTPSHHRVHHSRNPEYIDKNYGGMLIIWDRLFGTFKAEDKTNPPVYGLVHPVRSFNPIYVQFHPWRTIWRRIKRSKTFLEKLKVILYGPGWKPGLDRLGNYQDIPKIVRPINVYDPSLRQWQKAYVLVHFGMLLFFYHEITLYQDRFKALVINVGILVLIGSITSLGLLLDNRKRSVRAYELFRCVMFLMLRDQIMPIVLHGLDRAGLSWPYKLIVISSVTGIFALSILILAADLLVGLLVQLMPESDKEKKAEMDSNHSSIGKTSYEREMLQKPIIT